VQRLEQQAILKAIKAESGCLNITETVVKLKVAIRPRQHIKRGDVIKDKLKIGGEDLLRQLIVSIELERRELKVCDFTCFGIQILRCLQRDF